MCDIILYRERPQRGPRKGDSPMYQQMSINDLAPIENEIYDFRCYPNHKNSVQRLRERFAEANSLIDFDQHDALVHLIGHVDGSDRAEDIADAALDAFGSLKGVLEARPEQLQTVPGIGFRTASLIATVRAFFGVYQQEMNAPMPKISNSREAESYTLSILSGRRTEAFYVVALNARCNVIGRRKVSEGSLSEVSAYPRIVTETALNYNAHSIILCHNHPGGTCAPSPEDISSTLQLQRILNALGILVLDHIIVANDKTYSMIQHGDIDYRTRK